MAHFKALVGLFMALALGA